MAELVFEGNEPLATMVPNQPTQQHFIPTPTGDISSPANDTAGPTPTPHEGASPDAAAMGAIE